MEQDEAIGGDIFMQIFGMSSSELFLASADLLISLIAIAFIVASAFTLRKGSNLAGTKYILASIAGYLIGFVCVISLSFLTEEENAVVEAISNIYLSSCLAIGAYGFFTLCKAIKGLNANKSSQPTR